MICSASSHESEEKEFVKSSAVVAIVAIATVEAPIVGRGDRPVAPCANPVRPEAERELSVPGPVEGLPCHQVSLQEARVYTPAQRLEQTAAHARRASQLKNLK